MAIITTPYRAIVSAYRPIQFEVMTTGGGNQIPQNAVVDLYVNGDLKSTFRVKSSGIAPTLFPPIEEYKFIIDVSERMRDLIGPYSEIPSIFIQNCPTEPVINYDSMSNFYLDIKYEYLNLDTGLIQPQLGVNDITNLFWATNITRQNLEPMYLDTFTINSNDGRALTNSPKNLEVCREDNIYLSWLIPPSLNNAVNSYKIKLYDAAGLEFGSAIGILNYPAPDAYFFTFNTGIENGLKCLILNQQTPSFDLDSPLIASYSITLGIFLVGIFIEYRENFVYKLKKSCGCCEKRKFRLHWMNNLGGVDSFTFCSIKELKYSSKAVLAEKALAWDYTSLNPNDPSDSSQFKTRSTDELKYRIVSQDLNNEYAIWLAELLGSVKVYLEVETNLFIPVIVGDSEQIISKEKGKRKLELNISLSSCIIKQTI